MPLSPFGNEIAARGQIAYIERAMEEIRQAWVEFEPLIGGNWDIEGEYITFRWHEPKRFSSGEDHLWVVPLEALWNLDGVIERMRAAREKEAEDAQLTAAQLRKQRELEYDKYLIRQAKARGLIPEDAVFEGVVGEAREREGI